MKKPTWVYMNKLGRYNPVCTDLGDIEEIEAEYHGGQGEGSGVIIANGKTYGIGNKPNIVAAVGWVCLQPIGDSYVPLDILYKDGEIVDMTGVSGYFNWSSSCCDPRVLYICLWGIWKRHNGKPSPATKIPSWEEAYDWIRRVGIPEKPLFFDGSCPKVSPLLHKSFPLWYNKDKIMTPQELQEREEE